MDVFVARQPILDTASAVYAYELLFRSGPENFFSHGDADEASRRVMENAFHAFGLDALSSGKRLFINLTREVLLEDVLALFPPALVVAEVLETVEPDAAVLAAIRALRARGHLIALDDFVFHPGWEPLVALADVIKVDFRLTQGDARAALVRSFGRPGLRFLAEKVETRAEFEEARAAGYSLFQGYYFAKPQMVEAKDVAPSKLARLRLLRDLIADPLDHDAIERTIKTDLALSVKLLRYLNSAAFGWRSRIDSIKRALVQLGDGPFRQWAALVAIALLGDGQPEELLVMSLSRARFCEQLALALGDRAHAFELFLAGLLSSIDALLGRPQAELLEAMAVPAAVRDLLLSGTGALVGTYAAAVAYQRGEWAHPALRALPLAEQEVARLWKQALEWARALE